MVDEQIVKNIKDPSIVDWLLPAFTTTTPKDRIVASISVMSSMKQYFKYCPSYTSDAADELPRADY